MPVAFVMINTDTGREEDVLKKLKKLSNVKEVYTVYGVYDIVVKVEAESMEKLKENVFANIRRIEEVRSTLTMIVTHGFP
ncbi:MAG: Lrp/AsnC family transcriptional regulator [Candidatus Bathyarchaeia archaeon]